MPVRVAVMVGLQSGFYAAKSQIRMTFTFWADTTQKLKHHTGALMKRSTILGMALIGVTSFSFTEGFAADGKNCATIENDSVRLACYDYAFRPASAPRTISDLESAWTDKEEISAVDDTKSYAAMLKAKEVKSSFGITPNSFLILRCDKNSLKAYVTTNGVFSDLNEIVVRVDKGQADIQTHMWDVSATGQALGLWTDRNARSLIAGLNENGSFAIRANGRHSFEAAFDTSDVTRVKEKLFALCPSE